MKEPVWIDERDVRALHDRLLALDGGAAGVRDAGLLASALARPQQHHAYGGSPDMLNLAAIYTAGIVKNHPFTDREQTHGIRRGHPVAGAERLPVHGQRGGRDSGCPGARRRRDRRGGVRGISPGGFETAEEEKAGISG